MLDLKLDRAASEPRPAATLLLLRDAAEGLEVFCVVRNAASKFLGGAVVFPGGKVDGHDASPELAHHARGLPASRDGFASNDEELRAFAVAALRESLEEAALLPLAEGALSDDDLRDLRQRLAAGASFASVLDEEGLVVDLSSLHPFARWVTPEAEARRYDTRFFLCRAPAGQAGAHDDGETTASFWATPGDVLARFDRGEIALAPPTHRCLELLAPLANVEAALSFAGRAGLLPICPRLVEVPHGEGTTLALVLPGDAEHPVVEARVPGASRYVLRDGKFVPEEGPRSSPP
jgi:8-oxo-dGTP pyrophosphatase MutT (NUDIX family)